MHILLTDVLSCPRCGAAHGLIVLADRQEGRRVLDGRLGCANCREEYPIHGGVTDLRHGGDALPAPASGPDAGADGDDERAYRLAALLAVGDLPATVLLLGAGAPLADAVARLLPSARVAAAPAPSGQASAGASWLLFGRTFPFRDRSLRGVAVASGWEAWMAGEAARVLSSGGHLVVDPAPHGTAAELRSRGFSPLLDQDGVVVASAP